MRRLSPKPWETIEERYLVGDVVDAVVTKLANFGAFAKLEDTIEGLIHLTELSVDPIEHPNQIIKEGDVIQVKILKIEPDRKRLGLSLIQAATPDAVVDPDSIDLDAQYENVDNEIEFNSTSDSTEDRVVNDDQDESDQDEIDQDESDQYESDQDSDNIDN